MKTPLPILLSLGLAVTAPAQRRNVLLIIADDLGTDSLALYNSSPGAALPPTPNIDALKAGGVQFRNAYAHPTCSPTRASILTGRQPFRHGVTTAVSANDGQLMAGEYTLPRAFASHSALGYSLAHFGKWHLSLSNNMANDPANIAGWPHFAGSLNGGLTGGNGGTGTYFAWTKTINGITGPENSTTTYATTDTTDDTINWINAQGANPWFAWVAYNAPHSPFHKPPAALHTYDTTVPNWNTLPINTNLRTHFNAAIQALDTEMGRLFANIPPAVLANTWIIFIGDNGTPNQVIQPPFSNGHSKESLYEGGVRVPLIVTGPGLVAPNREVTDLVHATDLYASILEMAGIDVAATQPALKPIDSRSLLPLLQNQPLAARAASSQLSGSTVAADKGGATVRSGDYKLNRFNDNTESLHFLPTDPDERTNLLLSPLNTTAQAAYDDLTDQLAGNISPPNLLGTPPETQWQKITGAEYARIYRTQNRALNGISDATWAPEGAVRNGRQDLPAYAGIESIRVSANWVYVKGSSMPHYTMGPWYFDAAKTQLFVNYPSQWDMLARIPRLPVPAATRTNTNFGPIAIWVNTAIIHNQLDAFYWNGSSDIDDNARGTEYWTRNARLAEGLTFDPAGAHQPFTGESHHHISPFALRYEMGDHMEYNPATHTYTEASGAPAHSPILGWSFDGYPIYGPYGYGISTDPNSAVRRIVSGYVPRDGNFGTTNLNTAGRTTLPAWAIRSGHGISPVADAATGPAVSAAFPIGWYLQDYDYLGDRGYTQGTDFDLDECNGRWCITPEFPEGTYAYFVTIDSSFQPAYPYIIGRQYHGVKQGGNFAAASTIGFNALEEPNVTTYQGGADAQLEIDRIEPSGGNVTIRWDSAEGGNYVVETSVDLTDWTTIPQVPADGSAFQTQRTIPAASPNRSFHRVRRDSVDAYDVIDTP
ncbi:sulfatase-like hydrolase/transferase [Akkermansiaceae bacterium]|nr:sulfatase-like hydrolase/transferase [Akkermansiaceae bacterium]